MNQAAESTYTAPWSASLVTISLLGTVLCAGAAISITWKFNECPAWVGFIPLTIVIVAALFTVRGYSVTPKAIFVHRLLWKTRLPLSRLQEARFEPNAMRGSFRSFGNGGLFSFSGWFHNTALGTYHAFVTDPHRSVVLWFAERIVLVSPASPEDFVRDIISRKEIAY